MAKTSINDGHFSSEVDSLGREIPEVGKKGRLAEMCSEVREQRESEQSSSSRSCKAEVCGPASE